MKPHWTNKKCCNCEADFIDRSNAQKAKSCSKRCTSSFLYKQNTEEKKAKSKVYKAKPGRHEAEREINRQYYLENKSKIDEQGKTWAKNNRALKNYAQAKRRAAQKQATPSWLTEEQKHSIKLFYLAAKWVEEILEEEIHVDHIHPLQGDSSSGLHVPWNLQLLTKKANLSKSNKEKPQDV